MMGLDKWTFTKQSGRRNHSKVWINHEHGYLTVVLRNIIDTTDGLILEDLYAKIKNLQSAFQSTIKMVDQVIDCRVRPGLYIINAEKGFLRIHQTFSWERCKNLDAEVIKSMLAKGKYPVLQWTVT